MGQKLAAYNTSGVITAFYDSVDSPAPTGINSIDITESEWQTCISQGGWKVANGALVAPPAPTAAELLQTAQAAQIASLTASYKAAMIAPVTVTLASGTAASFSTDAQSLTNLNEAIAANAANGTWLPNFWYTSAGSTVSPVTYADLHTIAQAIQAAEVPDIQNLHAKVGEVLAATTISAVQVIVF